MRERCRGVSWEQTAAEPRPCVRCHVTKDASAFPSHGRLGTRRGKGKHAGVTRVCWSCVEAEAYAMHVAGYKPRIRKDWTTRAGVEMRVCTNCKQAKPRTREFFERLYEADGLVRTCRKCRYQMSKRARDRQREREGDAVRARHAAYTRRRRKLASVKASERKARKRWRAKMKSTPEGRARLAETERMSRRLRDERLGRPSGSGKGTRLRSPTATARLPSAPLLALVERLVDQRREIAEVLNEPSKRAVETVCASLGITGHTYWRWRRGKHPTVQIGTAEKVLLNAGVEWHEVYSYDDHAAIFLAVEVES